MSRNLRLSQRVFSILLALVFLGGCKQSGMSLTSLWEQRPKASTGGGLLASDSPGGSTAHQQADLEIAMARSLERQGQTDRAIKV